MPFVPGGQPQTTAPAYWDAAGVVRQAQATYAIDPATGAAVGNMPLPATVGPTAVANVNDAVTINTAGIATVGLYFNRTSGATIAFEGTLDGTNWFPVSGTNINPQSTASTSQVSTTGSGIFEFNVSAINQLRGRVTTAGVATITLVPSRYPISSSAVVAYLPTGSATIGALISTSYFADTVAPLASAGAFTGTTRDLGTSSATIPFTTFGASFFADQPGTAFIEQSVAGGATWRVVATQAVTANTNVDLNVPIRARYYRVRYLNGATANTIFEINSSFRD